ncbi:MAG: ThiF family adenylyltransferase [Candidatus Brocadia sp.]|nr:ThiF family adenylyltransferase [Candidatus Brocadia sp.]
MTIKYDKPSKELLCGIRALAGIQKCEILEKPVFFTEEKLWLLKVRLLTEKTSDFIPSATTWCVLIHEAYPLGTIEIYPDKIDGITVTFPHQERNEEGKENIPWRTGKICVDSPIRSLGLLRQNPDPTGDADMRLCWYIERSLAWLSSATRNELVQVGDPFELPQYPILKSPLQLRVVHDEGRESYVKWLSSNTRIGEVIFESFLTDKTLIAVEFNDFKGNLIRKASFREEWKKEGKQREKRTGIWWRWDSPAVLDPWEVPTTWRDLRFVGRKLSVNVDEMLRIIARKIRGKKEQVLLLGYPIPLLKGKIACEMHWRAISIPYLEKESRPPNGFRSNERGWWYRDRTTVFANDEKIYYIMTHNLHPDRLQARGRIAQALREMHTLIIGVGSLGSVITELLVRGGIKNVILLDHDVLTAGNIVRHVLTFRDLEDNKAKALRDRLLTVNPFVNIVAHEKRFPNTKEAVEKLLGEVDLIIDCTASEGVIEELSLGWWPIPKIFVSLSLGFKGRRLFVFINNGHRFPAEEFKKSLHPWIHKEEKVMSDQGETLEGPGCWSPIFPARYDDVMLAAASAIKVIEEVAEKRNITSQLIVYEQEDDNKGFKGFRRVG